MIAQLDRRYVTTRPTKAVSRLVSYAFFEGRPATTRGRWVNPLIFRGFSLLARLPQLRQVREPVFIIGMGRSGTTVLGKILSMHRDVGFLNEPKALWQAVHPDVDVVGNYSGGPARYRLTAEDADPGVVSRAHKLFGAYLAAVFSRRLVDKYPELVFRTPFVRAIFPDAKFILIVRNGWDACVSIAEWSRRNRVVTTAGVQDWWGVNQRKWTLLQSELVASDPAFEGLRSLVAGLHRPPDMAAVEWIVTMREGLRRAAEERDRLLMLKYEDLASRPRDSLAHIADFAGLAADAKFLDYGEQALQPSPNRSRTDLHPALHELFESTLTSLGY